jgi:hypothetical protein
MKVTIFHCLWIAVLLTGMVNSVGKELDPSQRVMESQFTVQLINPVHPELGRESFDVIQTKGTNDFPLNYRIQLVTDICLDHRCDILDVTVFWDPLGQFLKIEHPANKPMTKLNHARFSETDYDRLNSILHDSQSMLGTYPVTAFSDNEAHSNDVDGVSGATAISVENYVVNGAAYTSWALWHWVNNESVVQQLREITRKTAPLDFFEYCLMSRDPHKVRYALENMPDVTLLSSNRLEIAVLDALKHADLENSKRALNCLKKIMPDAEARNLQLAKILRETDLVSQRQILDELSSSPTVTPDVLAALCADLNQSPYFSVHMILTLFEKNNFSSETVDQAVEKLVSSDNAFIARRAREYLDRIKR